MSWAVSSAFSGSREMIVAERFPPHAGRWSRSSWRAMTINRIGASRDQSEICSTRSQQGLCPLQIVEHHDQRLVGGQRFQEGADRPGCLVGNGFSPCETDGLADALGDPVAVSALPQHGTDAPYVGGWVSAGASPIAVAARTISAIGQYVMPSP